MVISSNLGKGLIGRYRPGLQRFSYVKWLFSEDQMYDVTIVNNTILDTWNFLRD